MSAYLGEDGLEMDLGVAAGPLHVAAGPLLAAGATAAAELLWHTQGREPPAPQPWETRVRGERRAGLGGGDGAIPGDVAKERIFVVGGAG